MLTRRVFNVDSLSTPADEHRVDLLLRADTHPQTGKPRAGFKTVGQSQAEDAARALALRATASSLLSTRGKTPPAPPIPGLTRLDLDPRAATNLADRLDAGAESGAPQPTLASALFMREPRLRFPGALLELIATNPGTDIRLVTAIHPSWCIPATWLMDVDARQIKNQLRTQLTRAGVTRSPGFFMACLHGEFEPLSQEFQLHFHGVCAGEKLKAFDRIRNKQGYVRTPKIYRPIVASKIMDPARQLSYVMQAFWPQKARTPSGRRQRDGQRIEEPYQSLYLMWLDQWRLNDLCLLNGIRIQGAKIRLT